MFCFYIYIFCLRVEFTRGKTQNKREEAGEKAEKYVEGRENPEEIFSTGIGYKIFHSIVQKIIIIINRFFYGFLFLFEIFETNFLQTHHKPIFLQLFHERK